MKSIERVLRIFTFAFLGLLPFALSSQNITDMKGFKQGLWIETEGAFTSKGRYTDNQKDGTWIIYFADTKMLFKVESYKRGMKD